ncbi:DC1 - like 4, partial [Theobroma cacao]
ACVDIFSSYEEENKSSLCGLTAPQTTLLSLAVDKISFEKVSSSTPQSVYSNTLLTEEMEHNEVIDGIRTPQQLLFRAIIHEHAMRFCEVVEKSKKNHYCEACRLVLSGPCYICTTCLDANEEYCLHEKCARLPYEIQHPFHSSHRLNLYTTYSDEIGLIICDECRDVCFGFFYRCDECDFKLDVKCATLTVHKTEVLQLKKMERVVQLNPFYHPHKLVFGNFSDPTPKKACKFCSLPMLGPAYFCPNYYCHFQVHESCLRTPQKIRVPFHLENMLLGKINNDSQCYACGKDTYPFRYSCKQPYLKLHPQCVSSLRRPLICESHKHYLYYFGTKFQQLPAVYAFSYLELEFEKHSVKRLFFSNSALMWRPLSIPLIFSAFLCGAIAAIFGVGVVFIFIAPSRCLFLLVGFWEKEHFSGRESPVESKEEDSTASELEE